MKRCVVLVGVAALCLPGPLAAAPVARDATSYGGLGGEGWAVSAAKLRGRTGAWFHFLCPAGGTLGQVWGTDVYADTSSVCTAAVHAGRMTTAAGAMITIEIRAGAASYTGTARNGVTSLSAGASPGSFAIVGAFASSAPLSLGGTWTATAKSLRGKNGRQFWFACPAPGSVAARVWGSGTYADESAVCVAAVHAGLITAAWGGYAHIEIRAGKPSYVGATKHGVTSRSRSGTPGSFVFVVG